MSEQTPGLKMERLCDPSSGETIAVIVYSWPVEPGIQFFTSPEDHLQLGCMKRPKGHRVHPHVHKTLPRTIQSAEALFIRSGRLRVDLCTLPPGDDLGCLKFTSRILVAGDVVLLLSGGHGVEFLEESEVWEVKIGPWSNDKRRLGNATV